MLPLTHLRVRGSSVRGRRAPAVGSMLRQDELAFIQATSNIELSPVFLREVRKAVAACKKRKALAATKANAASASALECQCRVGSEDLASCDRPRITYRERPVTRTDRGWDGVRNGGYSARRLATAKWAAQAPSHGFR